jgi:xylulokinase
MASKVMNPLVLAVDIGTSRTKAVVVDSDATIVFQTSISHQETTLASGAHEHSALNDWWREFLSIARQLVSADRSLLRRISCVFVSGLFPCICCTDCNGEPLTPAFLYDDIRAKALASTLSSEIDTTFPGNALIPRLIWLRQVDPLALNSTCKVFSAHSFIVFKLTDHYCLDSHTAYLYGPGFEPATFSWNTALFKTLDLNPQILPEVLPPSDIAGNVSPSAEAATGLPSGIPVLVGTGDLFASLVGSGASSPDDLFVHYGSGGVLMSLTTDVEDIFSATRYAETTDGVDWIAGLPRSGKRLDWFRAFYPISDADLNPSVIMDSKATFYYGPTGPAPMDHLDQPIASFTNLSLSDRPLDLYRAMLESFGFAFRQGIESHLFRSPFQRLFAGGGGCRSIAWCQIVTDILQREQFICFAADTSIGGALIAGHKIGIFRLADVLALRRRQALRLTPQGHMKAYYEARYKLYLG